MRVLSIFLVLSAVVLGCSDAQLHEFVSEESGDKSSDHEARQQPTGAPTEPPVEEPSHLIASALEDYLGPQQGLLADGLLPPTSSSEHARGRAPVRPVSGIESHVPGVVRHADAAGPPRDATAARSAVVEGINRFAVDLYQQLRRGKGNLFFSPCSISTALAMTYAGAAGGTAVEMAATLHFQMPSESLHAGMRALQTPWKELDGTNGIQLRMANRLWGQEGFRFLPNFLQTTRDQYGADLVALNFDQTEEARYVINTWVEERTDGHIRDLIRSDDLPADTRLVLTNAIFFHGTWAGPFDEHLTQNEDFHLTSSIKAQVPMMRRIEAARYGARGDLQILELPYGDGGLSMVILLPRQHDGLAELEAKLSVESLQWWMASVAHRAEVDVSLPRFKMSSRFDMRETLSSMGMPSAFDRHAADFSGMTGDQRLHIYKVVHQATVDVNEAGTIAAAATGVVMVPVSAPSPPPVFRADHPFIILIRDNRSGAILFMGRVTNPLA